MQDKICRCVIWGKAPYTGLARPLELQDFEAPGFLDSRLMKVARLSAVRTGRFYTQGDTRGTH
jgi:hypothetical protein